MNTKDRKNPVKPQHINTVPDLRRGMDLLFATDSRFTAICALTGLPPLRRRPDGFEALLFIITEQLISRKAADAIWQRTKITLAPFDPQAILDAEEFRFREAGQSGPKIRAMRATASAVLDGSLNLAKMHDLPDQDAAAMLTKIKGIGPWTAEIYLLACLGRTDAWPASDLALQVALQKAFDLPNRPDAKQMIEIAETWRPVRSVAARLLWSYYAKVT